MFNKWSDWRGSTLYCCVSTPLAAGSNLSALHDLAYFLNFNVDSGLIYASAGCVPMHTHVRQQAYSRRWVGGLVGEKANREMVSKHQTIWQESLVAVIKVVTPERTLWL